MAHYQKRGENSFLLVVDLGRDGRGRRIRRTKTVRVEDEKLLRAPRRLENYLNQQLYTFQAKVEAGEYINTKNLKFRDFVDDWYEKHAYKNLEKTTIKNYKAHLDNYILPYFGNMHLDKIKAIHVVNFLDEISKPNASNKGKTLSDATIYEFDKTLRVVLNKAVEWQVLKEHPLKNLPRPKVKKRKMKTYNEDDFNKMVESLYKEEPVWRMFFLTSALSGMRRSEVIALQWNDINFEEHYIRLKRSIPIRIDGQPHIKGTKTDEHERIVYMPEWYMNELLQYKEYWDLERYAVGDKWKGGKYEFVFHDGYGNSYTPESATNTWGKIVKRHNLKDIRLHDLRHTMITYLLNRGESPFNVSKRAGHSDVKVTTDIYGHADEYGGKSAAKHFERFKIDDLDNNWTTNDIIIQPDKSGKC